MATMPDERTSDARAELQAWYLHGPQPKLARAASTGAVDPQAVAALDAEVRRFLDLYRVRARSWVVEQTIEQSEVSP
jgi:hypothetical protein